MLAAERKYRIAEYVKQHRVATIAALAKEFGVHEATIRRDLSEIEQDGLIRRTHGGATTDQWTSHEPPFNERTGHQLEQKMLIGKLAASLVEDGDHIIIDSGTTTLHIAKNLFHRSNITVVTNDMNIAAELRNASGIKVILTGGDLYPCSYMLNGMFTENVLDAVHVNKAFIGIPSIHPQHGLMHPEAVLVPTKQKMIKAAQDVIVVADGSKVGKLSLHTVAPNHQIHTLITGKDAPEHDIKLLRESGVEVLLV